MEPWLNAMVRVGEISIVVERIILMVLCMTLGMNYLCRMEIVSCCLHESARKAFVATTSFHLTRMIYQGRLETSLERPACTLFFYENPQKLYAKVPLCHKNKPHQVFPQMNWNIWHSKGFGHPGLMIYALCCGWAHSCD